MIHQSVQLPNEAICDLCQRYEVRELAVFGSVVRSDFSPQSDIDFLVEFEPEARVGLIEFCSLQNDLEDLLHRPVDLVSKRGLKQLIRQQVLQERAIVYPA